MPDSVRRQISVVLTSSKTEKLQLLFLETAAKDCVYLKPLTPKILAVLPEGLSLLVLCKILIALSALGGGRGMVREGETCQDAIPYLCP